MNDSPNKGTVVSFAAMRAELLSKRRLSPTVDARERARAATEAIDDDAQYEIPLNQAFTILCYLNGVSQHPDVQWELNCEIGRHMDNLQFKVVPSGVSQRSSLPVKIMVEGRSLKKISGIVLTDMIEDMHKRYEQAVHKEGGEMIEDHHAGQVPEA